MDRLKKIIPVLVSIIALFALLLVTGSVAFYSEVSNCNKCHEMKPFYDSWRVSSHSGIDCDECHTRTASQGTFSVSGTTISRLIAHFAKTNKEPKASVSNEHCGGCHSSIKKRIKAGPGRVINPHPDHMAAGFKCVDCHKKLFHPKTVTTETKVRMEDCMNCHRSKEVSVECSTCHFGSQEHIDKIAKAGGYVLSKGQSCEVCHTSKEKCKTDHKKAMQNIGGYAGLETCTKCHVDSKSQILGSVHSKLKTKAASVEGVDEGMGMATQAAYPDRWAYQLKAKDGKIKSGNCGQCHVGGNLPTSRTALMVDCLICHAKTYDLSKRRVIKVGTDMKWVGDDSAEAAASVGLPVAGNCGRCHEKRMSQRRGVPYTAKTDVHARAGMPCQSCHITVNHKIAMGRVADLMANDMPEVSVQCISCHLGYTHGVESIDVHNARMSCQACHVAKVKGMLVRDRTTGVDPDNDGIFEDRMIDKDDIEPSFLWFNGSRTDGGWPIGSRKDKRAKIYPFKTYTQITGVDPVTKKPVSVSTIVFAQTGSFDSAVKAAAQAKGLPAPKWIKVETKSVKQLNHAIDRKGLVCSKCHADKSIVDFKALGYSKDEFKKLTQPQSYSK